MRIDPSTKEVRCKQCLRLLPTNNFPLYNKKNPYNIYNICRSCFNTNDRIRKAYKRGQDVSKNVNDLVKSTVVGSLPRRILDIYNEVNNVTQADDGELQTMCKMTKIEFEELAAEKGFKDSLTFYDFIEESYKNDGRDKVGNNAALLEELYYIAY
jgi:hypothetical protein